MNEDDSVNLNWGDETLTALAARMQIAYKHKITHHVAGWIVAIFAVTLTTVIVSGMAICLIKSAAEATETITKAFLPFLQGVGSFASTLFGPLLAFILGYYFRQQNTDRDHSA
jgi:hypothetical protein